MHNFNAEAEIAKIRQRKEIGRQQSYHKSRLRHYRAELVQMRKAGASYPELALWLRIEKRIKVAHTTVLRFLKKLPEMIHEQQG